MTFQQIRRAAISAELARREQKKARLLTASVKARVVINIKIEVSQ